MPRSPWKSLIGCEADVLAPGVVTIDLSFATIFDYVIVSPNHYHLAWVENRPVRQLPWNNALNTCWLPILPRPTLQRKSLPSLHLRVFKVC